MSALVHARLRVFAVLSVLCLLAGCSASSPPGAPEPPASQPPPFAVRGEYLRNVLNEPSGLCFHPARGTLFAVGDEGDIYELSLMCELIRARHVADEDFEGIACDPRSGLLYVVVESADTVLQVDPEEFRIRARYAIPRTFEGQPVLAQGGDGLEGIAWLPDPQGTGRNLFVLANQSMTLGTASDSSCLLIVELREAGDAVVLEVLRPPLIDIAALSYDASADCLYAVSDRNNTLSALRRDGSVMHTVALPGNDQEGLWAAPDGTLYVAQDSGGILVLAPPAAPP